MRLGAVLCGCFYAAIAPAAPAFAQTYVGVVAEEPADTLARNVKILATEPTDFNALIAAGKAALALGDAQAAAGFFGRAEAISPQNPQPQIGVGAALAHGGDAYAALRYFARAVQLGASQSMVGSERGLAYDLLGYHAQAQSDYRAALVGPDAAEARRRLSLSLAITGNKAEALSLLGPLMAKGDSGAARCRAFVLALTGDPTGARVSIEAAMPGSSQRMAYFFHKLPTLRSEQKAAAVHLGLFPDAEQLASAPPMDQILARGVPSASQQPLARAPAQPNPPVQVASVRRQPVRTATTASTAATAAVMIPETSRHWVQLASGTNAAALPDQFRRIKSRNRDSFDFDGINGFVAQDGARARLIVGPFKNESDANEFAQNLESVRIDAFSWTSRPGQAIRQLPSE